MRGTSTWSVVAVVCAFSAGCGAGEQRLDPADLELRDLLDIAPEVALAWDLEQRAAARRVLQEGLAEERGEVIAPVARAGDTSATLGALDARREAAGIPPLGLVRVAWSGDMLATTAQRGVQAAAVLGGEPVLGALEIVLANEWDGRAYAHLPARGLELLGAFARDVGQEGRIVVAPAPSVAREATPGDPYRPMTPAAVASAGNPYSFYGSVAECAYAQRARCEACLPSSSCSPVTDTDGTTECTRLGESDGRGYYLLCANLAIAIASVENCVVEKASGCARNPEAAGAIASLESNATFVDDPACGGPLDACLADIYGAPDQEFPGLPTDGGMVPPPPTDPRDTYVGCDDGCSNNQTNNCEFSPNCSCDGPSCNNTLSCDSTCASSNSGGGTCGSCDTCDSSSSGGGGGGGGSGCSSDSSSSSSSCGGGGDCGGGGGDCGGGGCNSSSSCSAAKEQASPSVILAISLAWAFAPVPAAAYVRRRARRRKLLRASGEVVA